MMNFWQKFVLIPLLILTLLGPSLSPFAESFDFPQRYDLVAILAERGVYEDTIDYEGLADGAGIATPLETTTLKARIDRYAADLQNALPGTRALIIQTDRFEKTENVVAALERLYFRGDPAEPGRIAYLRGVVAVGEVPLPVVNKGGNRFISLYPYTDFEEKAYVWNPASGDFEMSNETSNPQPEIWHGVIRPPLSLQTADGKNALASYFDKNHLYHRGDPAYSRFEKRVFFQDFIAENKNLNAGVYKNYLNFVAHMDDIAYNRYTKELYRDLSGPAAAEQEELQQNAAEKMRDLERAGIPFDESTYEAELPADQQEILDDALEEGGFTAPPESPKPEAIPDITTKIGKMSDKLMARFNMLFSKYPSIINDLMRGTGRYVENMESTDYRILADTAVTQITAKDEYTVQYLKDVNTRMEAEIDHIAAVLEQKIPLGRFSVRALKVWRRTEDGEEEIELDEDDDRAKMVSFVNFSPAATYEYDGEADIDDEEDRTFPDRLNGYLLDAISSDPGIGVAVCTPFRGSPETAMVAASGGAAAGPGASARNYSKAVELSRQFDQNTAGNMKSLEEGEVMRASGLTFLEARDGYLGAPAGYQCALQEDGDDDVSDSECEGYLQFAGCFSGSFYGARGPSLRNTNACFPEHATNFVFEHPRYGLAGTRRVQSSALPPDFDNFNVCLQFHEESQYAGTGDDLDDDVDGRQISYLRSVYERLEALNAPYDCEPLPDCKATEQRTRMIENFVDPARKDKHPESITLYEDDDGRRISMGDILRRRGWRISDFSGFRPFLGKFFMDFYRGALTSPLTLPLPHHTQFSKVRISVGQTRVPPKTISSILYHKEPTNQTLAAHAAALSATDFPVDDPRYLTFQDRNGGVRKIVYPDLFKVAQGDPEAAVTAFRSQLVAVENQLNAAPRASGAAAPCTRCLQNILDSAVSQAKIRDALFWKNMDIDEKHRSMLEYYLDFAKDAYTAESAGGYELAYINGRGDASAYRFSLNKDVPEEGEDAPQGANRTGGEETELGSGSSRETSAPYDDDPGNPYDDEPEDTSGRAGYDLINWSLDPVSPWWERMQEWMDSLEQTNFEVSLGEDHGEFYEGLKEESARQLEEVKKESRAFEESLSGGPPVASTNVAGISLTADSRIVVVEKRLSVALQLLNKEGAPVRDEFARVDLYVEGGARFADSMLDEDPEKPGHQMTVMNAGAMEISLVAGDTPGPIKVTAQFEESSAAGEILLEAVETAHLELQSITRSVPANGTEHVSFDILAVDGDGQLIADANGLVRLNLSDSALGALSQTEVNLRGGRATALFLTGKKKGTVVISAASGPLDPGFFELALLPGPPRSIGLAADSEELPAVPGAQVTVEARLYDANGNMVDTNSSVPVFFSLTSKTEGFGLLSSREQTVKNGVAKITLMPREQTGPVTLIADSPGLASASITIQSLKQFGEREMRGMSSDSLAAALLGIPAGNVTENNFLGGWMMQSGKTQAVTTLTAQPQPGTKLFEVTSWGGLVIPDSRRLTANFFPSNNMSFVLRDNRLGQDLARYSLFVRREGELAETTETDPDKLGEGIYMRKISEDAAFAVDRSKGALRLLKGEEERVEVQTSGYLRVFDSRFSVRPKNAKYLTLEILEGDEVVAEIFVVQRFNQDVFVQPEGAGDVGAGAGADGALAAPQAPGVYLTPFKAPVQITFEKTFSGNSSSLPLGAAAVDSSEPVSGPSAPGFSHQSLEDSHRKFGVGFTEDNKFGLLFASGETFGEANRPYASDIGIVLGDPTVRVPASAAQTAADGTGGDFNNEVGKLLRAGDQDIRGIIRLDYNMDGFEDILLVEGEDKIRLLQNNGGADRIKDQGYIMRIKNGIRDIAKADINNDGQMDLVIAGERSCRKDETCLDIYENQRGAFVRRNIRFPQGDEKILTLRVEDLNLDDFPELIFADTAGDIRVIYNRRGVMDTNPQLVGNVGVNINAEENLISGTTLNYPGMTTKNPESVVSLQQYITVGDRDFIYADLDPAFTSSTKFGEDLNGGILRAGDRVRYTITLRNTGRAPVAGLTLSDAISRELEFDPASLKCTECGPAPVRAEFSGSADESRRVVFTGLRVGRGAAAVLTYETIFTGASEPAKIILTASAGFSDSDPDIQNLLRKDDFPDLAVTKEGNPTGRVLFFYSDGREPGSSRVNWAGNTLSTPAPPENLEDTAGVDIPTEDELQYPKKCVLPFGLSLRIRRPEEPALPGTITEEACVPPLGEVRPAGPPPAAQKHLDDLTLKDSDGDGLPDSIDDVQGALDDVASGVAGAVSKLTCNAGCLPMPINIAFLAPGPFNILGVPAGFDPGLPVFGWGAPSIVPTWPPMPSMSTLGGRFYISPSLTGGVGFAVCLGPFGTPKNCFSFGINVLDLLPGNICDKLSGGMNAGMSAANSAISDAATGLTVAIIDATGGATGTQSRRGTGSGVTNYSLGNYESPVATSRNMKIPGFPSVLTDWLTAQFEEFTTKALNIPDIYLLYPDPSSLIGDTKKALKLFEKVDESDNPFNAFLAAIHSLPLVDIETREVLIKIPFMSRKEVEKIKADGMQWIEDEKLWLDQWRTLAGCIGLGEEGVTANLDLCRFVTAEMGGLISSVNANIRALDEWVAFPKKVLQFRAIEAYYLGQIGNYLQQITELTGGWIKRNTARVQQWRKAVRTIRDTVKNWDAIIKIMIDYQESCDQCKSERFSLMDLIFKVFMAIPTPPVIPLPKLPDIVIDVSKLQTGARITWPDVKFAIEPFTFPKLPRIAPGANLDIPAFRLILPKIPVIPAPPQLPELPSLPPLQLPKLPDIPPPPTLPALPAELELVTNVLKSVFKIYCLIKLGFVPTDEIMLKTRIEQITARGLTPVLPIDMLLAFASPTINVEYVDKIVITAITNLQLDFSEIEEAVSAAATRINSFSTDITKDVNAFTQALSKQLEKYTSPKLNLPVPGPEGREFNLLDKKAVSAVELFAVMNKGFAALEKEKERRLREYEKLPREITLKAEVTLFAPKPLPSGKILPPDSLAARAAALNISDFMRMAGVSPVKDLKRYVAFLGETKGFPRELGPPLADTRPPSFVSTRSGLTRPELVLQNAPRLLAAAAPSTTAPFAPAPAGSADPAFSAVPNTGIFYAPPGGTGRRLIAYNLESSRSVQLADIDIDNDGDFDKLYSSGNNLYLKVSQIEEPDEAPEVFRAVDIEIVTIFELLPAGTSPNFPKAVSETALETTATFQKSSMAEPAGYEVLAKNSPLFFETPGRDPTWRVHLLAEAPLPAPQIGTSTDEGASAPDTAPGLVRNVYGQAAYFKVGEKEAVRLLPAQELKFGDRIEVQTGYVTVQYSRGGEHTIRAGEKYRLEKLENPDEALLSLNLDPAFYFAQISAFDVDGNFSNPSERLLLAPQVCSDETPPHALSGSDRVQVAVGKTLRLDASRSFDSESAVVEYWLDTDMNGTRDQGGASPIFTVGPFDEVGEHPVRLIVVDGAGNEGYQDIIVEVVTPKIILEVPPLRSNVISGYVSPSDTNVPVTIARLRESTGWEMLRTPTADEGGQYFTDSDGRFRIEDANFRDSLVVRNNENMVVAEINRRTGRIMILDERYETRLIPAQAASAAVPALPMRLGVFEKSGALTPLTTVYFVPDVNTDAVVDPIEVEYGKESFETMFGAHIKPLEAAEDFDLEFRALAGNDQTAPGAAVMERSGARLLTLQTNGDISWTDPKISLRVKALNLLPRELLESEEPVIFEVLFEDEAVAEIFIASRPIQEGRLQIVEAAKQPERRLPKIPESPFRDVPPSDPFRETAQQLFTRGIIAGYPSSVKGQLDFKPERRINRAEFTQITEKMLCIVPREEARRLPSPFYDVLDPKLWFYPVVKEGNIRGFIRGYTGEGRTEPDGTTRTPFKPANNITWAEAATVVLAALAEEDILDVSHYDFSPSAGGPWYAPYISLAQNLSPVLKNPADREKRSYLLTPEEAARANEPITRGEFAEMAARVLLIYDCNDPDTDDDKIPDVWERLEAGDLQTFPGPEAPEAAPEKLLNEEGIYVVEPACGEVCPCRATLGSGADLQAGDLIFAAITGSGGVPLYAKSNEASY